MSDWQRLAHGEYLPWVEQACGLKPQQASKLVKAAEWANVAHAQHLDSITDRNRSGEMGRAVDLGADQAA
jgi:hypothetical protein